MRSVLTVLMCISSLWRRGGSTVSALGSGIERFGFEPWPGHCSANLSKTLTLRIDFLRLGV